jgi:hypothetical protein
MDSRPRNRGALLAWALCGLSVALAVATVVLAQVNDSSLAEFVLDYQAVGPLGGAVASPLGALILTRYPGNRIGWVLVAMGMGLALLVCCAQYGALSLRSPQGVPAGEELGWLFSWGWMPVSGLLPYLFLLFPDGRLRSPRWRPLAWAAALALSVPPAVIAVLTWPYRAAGEWARGSLLPASAPESGLVAVSESAFFAAQALLVTAGLAALVVRVRVATGVERQQVKWFLYGGAVTVAITLFGAAFPSRETGVNALLTFAGLLAAIAVAVFRYRLYEIDRLINRTLVYAALSGLLGLVYVTGVFVLGGLLDPGRGDSPLAVAASTLAVAALFGPARRRIQAAVDRRFDRSRYDAARTIEAFSARLRGEIELDAMSAELLRVVDRTVQPARVSLWLRSRQ